MTVDQMIDELEKLQAQISQINTFTNVDSLRVSKAYRAVQSAIDCLSNLEEETEVTA